MTNVINITKARRRLLAPHMIGETREGKVFIRVSPYVSAYELTPGAAETFAKNLLQLAETARAEGSGQR